MSIYSYRKMTPDGEINATAKGIMFPEEREVLEKEG